MKHQARKRFGQNFLHDPSVLYLIAQAVRAKPTDHIVEIGPGQGALTDVLIDDSGHYSAVELDRDLIEPLREQFKQPQFHLYPADALQFDYDTLTPKPLRMVGNLPYNISAPLLMRWMEYHQEIQDIHVMLQQEMAERITAAPGTKDYGRLSVMLQYYCHAEALFAVPPEAFDPIPKVMSMVIRMIPYAQKPYIANDLHKLDQLLRQAFSQRRKTISNTLKPYFNKEQLIKFGIDPQQRPETITVKQYVTLSNQL
jgi:16S rRNA (adenine1518-N6/adenine1519-N6)-dimethyltransferase